MKRQSFNPYLPEGKYFPDGEPHVFGDRVYVYCSQDKFGASRFCTGDYEVWSAPLSDLSDWSCKKIALPRKNKYNKSGFKCMWAPDCTRGADGKFYLYFCFGFENKICVAKSDAPDGPFELIGTVKHADGKTYGTKKGDFMCFDPAVYTDANGNTYLYSGFAPARAIRTGLKLKGLKNVGAKGGQVMKLKPDMLTVDGSPRTTAPGLLNSKGTGFEGHEFYEASSMREVNGKYYFVYSTIKSHEIAYAVSDAPDGPFTFGGVIISNGDFGIEPEPSKAKTYWGNNHGSLVKLNGQWYIFYHKQTNKTEQSRQGCAEPVEISSDGKISQVETTSCGLNGGPLKGEGKYPAYIACNLRGANGAIKCAYGPFRRWTYGEHPCITEDGGRQYIQNMHRGAEAVFRYFKTEGLKGISATVRGGEGAIEVCADGSDKPFAKIPIRIEDGWTEFFAECSLEDGVHSFTFSYNGEGACDILEFSLKK